MENSCSTTSSLPSAPTRHKPSFITTNGVPSRVAKSPAMKPGAFLPIELFTNPETVGKEQGWEIGTLRNPSKDSQPYPGRLPESPNLTYPANALLYLYSEAAASVLA